LNFYTGMSYLQNQTQPKNLVMIVKTVFLCDALICCNLCLNLHKVDEGDGAISILCFQNLKNDLRQI